MSDPALATTAAAQPSVLFRGTAATASSADCPECLGSGGWLRYEPAADPAPGVLYLCCLHCRGSGRALLPRDPVLRTG